MILKDLYGKRVCIVGFGREGRSALNALKEKCEVTIADKNEKCETNLKCQTGENYLKHLEQFDVIVKSPGVPPCTELDAVKDKITSGTALFLEEAQHTNHIVIAVTGSKGKSTTASLIHHILKTAEKRSVLLGNIGTPALEHLDDLKNSEPMYLVMELSSYQLMNITCSPHIAVITSFFPEHLDYHGSLEAYKEAKKNIARFQKDGDVIFYADTPKETQDIAKMSRGKHMPYDKKDVVSVIEDFGCQLLGEHNIHNIAGAWKVAHHLELPEETTIQAIQSFAPLPHRLEEIETYDGIRWINDSMSTTPESTIVAIEAFDGNIDTLILGGQDRGLDFTHLIEHIASSAIQTVICLPGSGHRIANDLKKANINTIIVASLKEAIRHVLQKPLQPITHNLQPICLLSPASPSYNQFKNFEEKGAAFKKYITKYSPSLASSK